MGPENPEEEGSIKFTETLNDEIRTRITQELQGSERLAKLLLAMKPEQRSNPDRVSWVANFVDSEQGKGMAEKLFGAKMDMVRFINENISVSGGGPQAVKEKQWQYKQAMEGLFGALGMMQPQEEYRMLGAALSNRLVKTPEDQARYDLMEQRRQELEQDYGIQATQ